MASVMGSVEITNKLIMVKPIKSKYAPQVGDIVVGWVQKVANKRWRIDIKASGYAYFPSTPPTSPNSEKKTRRTSLT